MGVVIRFIKASVIVCSFFWLTWQWIATFAAIYVAWRIRFVIRRVYRLYRQGKLRPFAKLYLDAYHRRLPPTVEPLCCLLLAVAHLFLGKLYGTTMLQCLLDVHIPDILDRVLNSTIYVGHVMDPVNGERYLRAAFIQCITHGKIDIARALWLNFWSQQEESVRRELLSKASLIASDLQAIKMLRSLGADDSRMVLTAPCPRVGSDDLELLAVLKLRGQSNLRSYVSVNDLWRVESRIQSYRFALGSHIIDPLVDLSLSYL